MSHRPTRPHESGLATVEVALLLPVIATLLFAIFEYGWMFVNVQELGSAAHVGARVASYGDSSTADVTNAVNAVLTASGVTGATTTISPANPAGASPGQPITVTVTMPYAGARLTSFPLPMPASVKRSATMVREGS